ncbi:aspartate/glutamate racemase family protein [Oscillibacter sp.]|uniref:aspartate/glutamate racemase family protein n=1 Tax=Oscillibacter sp. TaxID=1945593 RepID=UPI00339A5D6E
MDELIAVLAGTPVDTRMGVAVLQKAGLAGVPFPVSEDPRAQTAFQLLPSEEKLAAMEAVLRTAMERGCRRALVYCNSMSASVDFSELSEKLGLPVVTPMDVYRRAAGMYRCLGVIAANAQGLAGIERALLASNPTLDLYGACALPAVLSVEAGEPPEELVLRHHLAELASWFQSCGAETLLLGCTHFPYFKAALAARTALPLLDPGQEMLRLLGAF